MLLDIAIEIAETLDRSDQDQDLVAEIGATAGGNCRLLLMGLRLATICTKSASMPWDTRHERRSRSRPS